VLFHSGKCDCALFGDYVGELSKKMGKAGEGLPVVVIQFAKVKIFRGSDILKLKSYMLFSNLC
jgi:F420-0:gamma-glutamyl ligase